MVTRIQSNIKGRDINAQLYPKTLIVGPSASGKSAVIGAVELAISGRISDVQGRDSSLRTVNRILGTGDQGVKLEVNYEGSKPQLLFGAVKEALQKSPLQAGLALLDLLGIKLDLVSEYRAFKAQQRRPQDYCRIVEAALAIPDMAKTELVAARIQLQAFLAAQQTEADRLGLVLDGLEQQLDAQVWPRLEGLRLAAEEFVPFRLGALVLDQGKVGLRSNGTTRFALSGSEWNIVLTALTCGVAELTKQEAVVIPDDRAIDSSLLSQWLDCLGGAQAQVLITSTNSPEHLPDGWELLLV